MQGPERLPADNIANLPPASPPLPFRHVRVPKILRQLLFVKCRQQDGFLGKRLFLQASFMLIPLHL